MTRHGESDLRVLMTADAVGGVWQYALQLADALAPFGAEILLAVMGPPPDTAQQTAAASVPGLTLVHRPYPLDWMNREVDDADGAAVWLADLVRAFAPDVVHLNGCTGAGLTSGVPKLLVMHSCVRTWWREVRGEDCPEGWRDYVERVCAALAEADVVVAPTAAYREMLQRAYGPQPHSRVIHNGRRPEAFVPSAKQPFVLAVGRAWDESKNLAAVDRVAGRLPWATCVAGPTAAPDGSSLPPGRHSRFLGNLDEHELARLLGKAAIFVSPARYEPFGLAVLEAAFSGCALVLSDIASFRELWDGCALFVDAEDDAALERAQRRLIDDASLRRGLAARSRHRAHRYTADRMGAAYMASYRELVGIVERRPMRDLPLAKELPG